MRSKLFTLAAALLVAGGPALAQSGGHGHSGGGFSGGHMSAGAHASGGGHAFTGGNHFAGGARGCAAPRSYAAPHFSGAHTAFQGHTGYAPRPGVAAHSYASGQYFAPRAGFNTGFHGVAGRSGFAHSGFVGARAGWAGRPGWHGGRFWGGGVWRGGYWPGVRYGWGFPLFLPILPAIYATYWWGGIPYYYVNDVYYTYNPDQSGYVVTDPPPVAGAADSGADNSQPGTGSTDVYAYPQNGQTDEQQSNDRYECHSWARSQSGFDPTHSSEGQSGNADDYRRAMTACLKGRGYSTE
jgi:hypothetical protein